MTIARADLHALRLIRELETTRGGLNDDVHSALLAVLARIAPPKPHGACPHSIGVPGRTGEIIGRSQCTVLGPHRKHAFAVATRIKTREPA